MEHLPIKEKRDEKGNNIYAVSRLQLSRLFREIFREYKQDLLPILECEFLLHGLKLIPFENEMKARKILKRLTKSIDEGTFTDKKLWKKVRFYENLLSLKKMIKQEYFLTGRIEFLPKNFIAYKDFCVSPISN